jgi:hypothetical protein
MVDGMTKLHAGEADEEQRDEDGEIVDAGKRDGERGGPSYGEAAVETAPAATSRNRFAEAGGERAAAGEADGVEREEDENRSASGRSGRCRRTKALARKAKNEAMPRPPMKVGPEEACRGTAPRSP